jgi:hypothetical protein
MHSRCAEKAILSLLGDVITRASSRADVDDQMPHLHDRSNGRLSTKRYLGLNRMINV